jgi:hypothetical protein
MDRRSLLIGFLAGGWIATLVAVSGFSPFPTVKAEDPPGVPPDPVTPTTPGRTINPSNPGPQPRGGANPGQGTAAFNNRAIALAGSIGSGESVVYYFDTELQRLLVYQFQSGSRGGIRLMAARHMDYDLKLEAYRDQSEKTRDQMKEDYDKYFAARGAGGGGQPDLPTKKVELPGGK